VARGGLFLSGVTLPAQAGVNVRIYSKRDQQLIASTSTDEAGAYRVGPLYDDLEYSVVGEKENFHCTPSTSNPLDIQLFRLGSVSVRVLLCWMFGFCCLCLHHHHLLSSSSSSTSSTSSSTCTHLHLLRLLWFRNLLVFGLLTLLASL
jgi:BOS complex subunit NOMO1-like, beta sandwich domain